jgi:polar amino acid transport system substrate-binding protein
VKKLAVLAIAAVVASTAAVASAHPAAPPKTITPGQLTVGLSLPSPGFQVGTISGSGTVTNAKGMEIDLANALAKQLGIKKVAFVNNGNFASIYASGKKKWDFALAEVTITPARAKTVDFSTPYFKANQGVLERKNLGVPVKSIADLKTLKLCAQIGTTGAAYIKDKIRPQQTPSFPATTTIMYQQVANGTCDAAIFDTPILASQKKLKPSEYGPLAAMIVTNENYGAVFQKGSSLRSPVNKAIATLTANGTIGKLQKKWFNINFTKLAKIK